MNQKKTFKKAGTKQRSESTIHDFLSILQKFRTFRGPESQFWNLYTDTLVQASESTIAMILQRHQSNAEDWSVVSFAPKDQQQNEYVSVLKDRVADLQEMCSEKGYGILQVGTQFIGGLTLKSVKKNQHFMGVFLLGEVTEDMAKSKIQIIHALGDIPADYHFKHAAQSAMLVQEQFANTLDLMVVLNEKEKFLASLMTLCNELAARYKCDRVSVGWQKKGYIRLQAMSHTDNFDKKMEATQKLELAMEEALDQDRELVIPALDEKSMVIRDHEEYCRTQGITHICSIPLRVNKEAVAVVTLERNAKAFSAGEVSILRLSCDQASRRLGDLHDNDKWFGAILLKKFRKKLFGLFGVEYTLAKLVGLIILAGLIFASFYPVPHRIDSTFILKTKRVNYLSAPFDGHIEDAFVQAGDSVSQDQDLLSLNKSDLLLEQSALMAEMQKYQSESEKAMAEKKLADMQIAEAQYEQAGSQLEIVNHKISKADIKAGYAGVIVEGDLKERIGSPVKQGDVLFKIATLDSMYTAIEVAETDIQFLQDNQTGEIAITSNPHEKFKVKVFRTEPAAVVKEEGNVFIVHAMFDGPTPEWFRPGMTGVAKLNSGEKPLLWIISRKTIDFLRLQLWW